MTAEIAVMNRQGVALAADSAVTFQGPHGPKIFSSADKIFGLSKFEPVAVMVYGSANFMQVPWETIVKVYRQQLGDTRFDSVEDYADDFLRFLASSEELFGDEQKRMFALASSLQMFNAIRGRMIAAVDEAARESSGPFTLRDARRVGLAIIGETHKRYTSGEDRSDLPTGIGDRIAETYADEIDQAKAIAFEDFKLPRGASKKLTEVSVAIRTKDDLEGDAGVVIAGFGTKDLFPKLVAYEMDGVLLDFLVRWEHSRTRVGPFDTAFVQGFAQDDVIHLFMEGVTEAYEDFIEGYVDRVIARYGDMVLSATPASPHRATLERALRGLEREMMAGVREEFAERRRQLYIDPVLDVVGSLPKDELGLMAESLVNLTSLKRRISMDDETVGGPIDVAVISKGDGLVWTRRKHYFDPGLNQHFFANYFK